MTSIPGLSRVFFFRDRELLKSPQGYAPLLVRSLYLDNGFHSILLSSDFASVMGLDFTVVAPLCCFPVSESVSVFEPVSVLRVLGLSQRYTLVLYIGLLGVRQSASSQLCIRRPGSLAAIIICKDGVQAVACCLPYPGYR